MAMVNSGGTRLYYKESGQGPPVVLVHEFGGDYRSWEPQVRHLSRFHRCVTFNARGYPPSDVPKDPQAYDQDIVADDVAAVLDHLSIESAHVVGLSMGSFTTLVFALRHPNRARSIVLCGCGYGSVAEQRQDWMAGNERMADSLVEDPVGTARAYAKGATRVQFRNKDPRGWHLFRRRLAKLDGVGASLTLRRVQGTRPGVFALETQLAALQTPTLIIVGDEDDPAVEPSLFLKRRIPRAGLWVFPKTGHTVNLEEPALFNEALLTFFAAVGNGRWDARDPLAVPLG
jgi:pimeloyl-ACP methyl ester carboxylesterase